MTSYNRIISNISSIFHRLFALRDYSHDYSSARKTIREITAYTHVNISATVFVEIIYQNVQSVRNGVVLSLLHLSNRYIDVFSATRTKQKSKCSSNRKDREQKK